MKIRKMLRIMTIITALMCLFTSQVIAEHEAWDCPDCDRNGNTGNYCGGCAHPAPWIESSVEQSQTKTLISVTIGDVITFGTYPQTAEGTDQTPIEWIILDYDEVNHKALLISKYGLDAVPYNKKSTAITWEQCTLRTWLNGEFLNKAFSTKEQSGILITDVDNNSDQGYSEWSKNGGNNTQDQFFLLSYAEANRYFGVKYKDHNNTESRVAPTAYAINHKAFTSDKYKTSFGENTGWWWLRSPGYYRSGAASVDCSGSLNDSSVDRSYGCVRPAFWLDLESGIF